MTDQPIIFRWTGEVFEPSTNYQAHLAGQRFAEGDVVALTEHFDRSKISHDHYFATLHELWTNLPERIAPAFPNEDVLRAHALIRTGYCNKRQVVLRSNAEASRVAAFMRPSNPLAIIDVDGPVVTEWTAESQKYRAMGKKRFQQSKDAVLGWVSDLVGLPANAEQRVAA